MHLTMLFSFPTSTYKKVLSEQDLKCFLSISQIHENGIFFIYNHHSRERKKKKRERKIIDETLIHSL